MGLTYHPSLLQLVHEAAGAIIANGELSLNEASTALLRRDNKAGGIVEHRVEVTQVGIVTAAISSIALHDRLGQLERLHVALLFGNELVDVDYFGRIDEGTLYTDGVVALQIEHVATTYELLCTHAVEDGLRVNTLAHLESDTCREVGLDGTGDDVRGRSLSGDDHVYANGTGFLGDACDG